MKRNVFSYRNDELCFNNAAASKIFTSTEISLLKLFIESENKTLELAQINLIFEFYSATQETIKKRREVCIKALRTKISELTKIPAAEVFIELKSDNDKRVKVLKLNFMLFV